MTDSTGSVATGKRDWWQRIRDWSGTYLGFYALYDLFYRHQEETWADLSRLVTYTHPVWDFLVSVCLDPEKLCAVTASMTVFFGAGMLVVENYRAMRKREQLQVEQSKSTSASDW